MSLKEEAIIGRRLKTSYFTTVASITLVLFVLGLIGLLVLNSQKLSQTIKENLGFTIVLKENTLASEITTLQNTLHEMPAVKSMVFVSSEEAAQILTEELGEDFVSFLGYNPLFPSIEVRMHAAYANPDSLKVFEARILENNLVREVHYQQDLVSLINENVRAISIGLILVGATGSFIRKPFVVSGILQGIVGSVAANLILLAVLYVASRHIPGIMELQDVRLLWALAGFVMLTGVFISWISTFFAVRKYLKLKTDHLY